MKSSPHLQPPPTQTKPSRWEDCPKALFQGSYSDPCLQRNCVQVQQCQKNSAWWGCLELLIFTQPQTHRIGFQGNQNYKELLLKLLLGLMHSPNLFSQRMGQAIHCQPWIWRGEVKTDWQGELLSYTMLLLVTLHYFKSAKTVTWKLQPPFWRWGWGMSERKTREGKK